MFIFDMLAAIFKAIWSIITHTYEAICLFLEGILQAFFQIFEAGSPAIKGILMSIIYGIGAIFYYGLEALKFVAEAIENNWGVAGPIIITALVLLCLKFKKRRRRDPRRR